ncbi:hypothetical protein ACFYWS_26350 [Streptomyces sp. NPDC002795]|uniref:hypothetical protein n=1 Tax=Streptomyces sp. NPDC002795 TaxID=3364665 RepID=UPI0036B024AB
MIVVATSVIAVLGTLLGATLSHILQSRTAARGQNFARAEQLRQERIAAYCAFGGALDNYRRGQLDRWFPTHVDRPGETVDVHELRREAQRLRTAAMEAMFRVDLLTADPALTTLAREAMASVDRIMTADDREELRLVRDESRGLIHDFIAASRPHVRVA